MFCKNVFLEIWQISQEKTRAAKFAKVLRMPILKKICERLYLTLLSLVCIDGYDRTGGPIRNSATGTLTSLKGPGTLLHQIALSNSNTRRCAPMQAVKQPEHGTASNTEVRNCFFFQTNYDSCNYKLCQRG